MNSSYPGRAKNRISALHAQRVCIYCGGLATTRDHVPPRLLLAKPPPKNLKTVRACVTCNRGASLDEQYFLILLSQISTSHTLQRQVAEGGSIHRALVRAPALDERIVRSLHVDNEQGRIYITPEVERLHRVIRKIGVGLFAIRYGKVPHPDTIGPVGAYPYDQRDDRPLPYRMATFTPRFRYRSWQHIQRDVFSYIFVSEPRSRRRVCCIMDFHRTLWGVLHLPHPRFLDRTGSSQLKLKF